MRPIIGRFFALQGGLHNSVSGKRVRVGGVVRKIGPRKTATKLIANRVDLGLPAKTPNEVLIAKIGPLVSKKSDSPDR